MYGFLCLTSSVSDQVDHVSKPNKFFPLFMIFLGALLLLGAGAWYFLNTDQTEQASPIDSSASQIPYPEIPRVSLADAHAALAIQSAVIVDVRGEEFYQQGHVAGALSIPEDQLPERINELDPNAWIITYCT